MPKAKKRVVRKSSKSVQARKPVKKSVTSQKQSKSSKKIIIVRNVLLAILLTVLVAILFLRFSGVTGNVITGNVANEDGVGQISGWGQDPDWKTPAWDEVGFILAILFGQTGYDVAVSKIIFALLSFMFVFYVTGRAADSMEIKLTPFWNGTLSFLLGILFTRWVGQDGLVKAVLMPYNVIGAAISTLIPIGIIFYMFFFMKPFNTAKYGPLRTIGLSLLIVFFLSNWGWTTWGNWGSVAKPQYSYVYLVAAVITGLILWKQRDILSQFKLALARESIDENMKNLDRDILLEIRKERQILESFPPSSQEHKDALKRIKEYNKIREEIAAGTYSGVWTKTFR